MIINRLIFLLIILLISSHYANSQRVDTIHWKDNVKLSWSDFKGCPDTTSEYKAITVAEINYILSYNTSSFQVKVTCFFDRMRSWTNSNDSIGLAHEKGHFDIAEIYARKLRKAFLEYKFNPITIQEDFKNLFLKIKADRKKFNDLYDKETNFSRNKSKQFYWNKLISAELKKNTRYKE